MYKTELLLFALGFGVRFLYAVFAQWKFGSGGFLAYSDAFSFYLRGAENLLAHHTFSLSTHAPFLPDAYRPPLYTLLVAAFLYLKLPLFCIIFLQNVLGGLMSVLIYKIGEVLSFPRRIGLFAAVLIGLEPMSVYWNNLLMSDTLYTFLFLLALYLFAHKRLLWFAFVFGLATLTRTVGVYFFPLFLVLFLWQERHAIPWKKLLLAALIFAAVLFPWMLRNRLIFGTWQLSSASWYNLYPNVMGQFAEREGFSLPLPPPLPAYTGDDAGLALYDFADVPFYKEHFAELFSAHPAAYLRFHASLVAASLLKNPYRYLSDYVVRPKLPFLYNGTGETAIALLIFFGGLFWYAAYLLAFLGGALLRAHRPWFLLLLSVMLVTLATLGALGLGADMSRYMLPLSPFILMFAALGGKTLA